MTRDQALSIVRHVVSYGSGAATVAVLFGLTSPAEGQSLTSALEEIANGLGHVISGVLAIAAIVAPLIAAVHGYKKSAPEELRERVAAQPETALIVTTPKLANASPSQKIVGTDSVTVIPAPLT